MSYLERDGVGQEKSYSKCKDESVNNMILFGILENL